ncbi:acylphosphatase [Vibrio hippocampi]|uniref:Acylphosphatase n=1 Tax=Vibrio hippocampi TaxID=654686 RepID=A0ABN8DFB7_9VIBR|nr:acylphosphatase [Vibrio hippocampi]CAH0525915.1 Acylphosphatase [Vibrio hippocampi]
MEQICAKAIVQGHVQGVGFRYHTCHQGLKLGLSGYAKNLNDGSVEVMACGAPQQVEQMFEWLKQDPRTAHVTGLNVEPCEYKHYKGFVIG